LPNLKAATLSAAAETTAHPKKVIIISSAIGSIEENGSGGHYGYRTSKAGVNMIGKSLAMDLKDDNICVGLIHPGYVLTGFDNAKRGQAKPSEERNPGQRDVGPSATGVLQAIDKVTMETTGSFWHGNYGEGVKQLPW
jgi:tubulin alpha